MKREFSRIETRKLCTNVWRIVASMDSSQTGTNFLTFFSIRIVHLKIFHVENFSLPKLQFSLSVSSILNPGKANDKLRIIVIRNRLPAQLVKYTIYISVPALRCPWYISTKIRSPTIVRSRLFRLVFSRISSLLSSIFASPCIRGWRGWLENRGVEQGD